MNRPLYILRLVLVVLLPLLMVLAPAKAQTVVYQGAKIPLSVVNVPGQTYDWEIYSDATVDFAKVPGNDPAKFATSATSATSATIATFLGGNRGAFIDVQWLKTGIYFFKVTAHDASNCSSNFKIGMIKVIPIELQAIIGGAKLTGACQQILLDASKSIGDIAKYEWSPVDKGGELTRQSGITTEFLLSPAYTGSLPADFRVRLFVTDRKGNTNSDTIKIKVDHPPVADVYSTGNIEKDGNLIVDASVSKGTALSYKWATSEGKIIGPDNQQTVKLSGAGVYSLEIVDIYGCKSSKLFKFPLDIRQIIARPDYARTSWAKDTTINVLANDESSSKLVPGSVRVITPPTRGVAKVNTDGSITYVPRDRRPGRDEFVYEVSDDVNLTASAKVTVDIYDSGVMSSEGFSPNGDGINDKLLFNGLDNYSNSSLYIYTRSGTLVFQSDSYTNDWDGRTAKSSVSGTELVPPGTYYYILKLGGTNRSLKGFIYVGY